MSWDTQASRCILDPVGPPCSHTDCSSVRSKWQATGAHAASRPCQRLLLWASTRVRLQEGKGIRGVCMYVLNAEGREGDTVGRTGQLGQSPAADDSRPAGRHRAPRSQQSPCRRFTFREGSARLPHALPLLTLLPWSRFFPHSSPSAHGGAREWVYTCLTSGLASEARLRLESASHKESLLRRERFREATSARFEATRAVLQSRGPARWRRKPTRRGSRRNRILRAPLKTLLGLRAPGAGSTLDLCHCSRQ